MHASSMHIIDDGVRTQVGERSGRGRTCVGRQVRVFICSMCASLLLFLSACAHQSGLHHAAMMSCLPQRVCMHTCHAHSWGHCHDFSEYQEKMLDLNCGMLHSHFFPSMLHSHLSPPMLHSHLSPSMLHPHLSPSMLHSLPPLHGAGAAPGVLAAVACALPRSFAVGAACTAGPGQALAACSQEGGQGSW